MVYRRGFAAIYGDECHASPGNGASAYSGGAKRTLGINRTGRQDAAIGFQGRSEFGYDGGDGHGISDAFCSVRTLAADRSSGGVIGWQLDACLSCCPSTASLTTKLALGIEIVFYMRGSFCFFDDRAFSFGSS